MFSGLPRHSGRRVTGEAMTALTTSSAGFVGIHGDHVGPMDHHVGHFEFAEAQDVLNVLGLTLLDVAVLSRDSTRPSSSTPVSTS